MMSHPFRALTLSVVFLCAFTGCASVTPPADHAAVSQSNGREGTLQPSPISAQVSARERSQTNECRRHDQDKHAVYHDITGLSNETALHAQLAEVKADDGIDEKEAAVLAEIYYLCKDGLCGGVDQIRRRGDVWEVTTLVGPKGRPGDVITVDARTGSISQKGNPTVHSPWTKLDAQLRATGN